MLILAKIQLISILIDFLSDEKSDAFLQAKEEVEHKNSQYEKLRREVSILFKISNLYL